MKLPDIEEAPVPDATGGFAQKAAAVQGLGGVIENGMMEINKEIVKSQHYKASADLLSGLDQAQVDLRTNKTLTTQQLRDALGADYDSLPQEIKQLTTKSEFNPATQQMEDQDRADIPMYAVAGHIFDSRSKKILEDAAGNFTSGGWGDEFKEQGAKEIIQQKQKLALKNMYEMQEHLSEQNTGAAIDLANAGRPEEARAVLAGDRTMDLKHKELVLDKVDKISQSRPLYEALRTGNIADMAHYLVQLGDDKQFSKLSPEERMSFTHRFESEIKEFQRQAKGAGEAILNQNAQDGWNGILGKQRAGQPVTFKDIPAPGMVKAEQQKEMISYVTAMNKGEKPETDPTTYAGLSDMAANHKDKFLQLDLTKYINRLNEATYQKFVDMQTGLKGGNPDPYDKFNTTDEAINTVLRSDKYKLDPSDKANAETVGFVKTAISHDLAAAEKIKGHPLAVEERDGIIQKSAARMIDPRRDKWFGLSTEPSRVITSKAGVDAAAAGQFQRAMNVLEPTIMGGTDSDKKIAVMQTWYKEYQKAEPVIDAAWKVQRGRSISPDDAVQVWYYTEDNKRRLGARLRSEGGWIEGNDAENFRKMINLAIQENLAKAGK